jgi:TATA-binding protein-associated factor
VKKEESPTPGLSASITASKQALASPAIQNDIDTDGLSARERNKLKRRAKTDLKFKGKDK